MERRHYQPEWDVFLKNARRFDDNPPEKRYGVLNPDANPPYKEEDMLYADCPLKLHNLHYDKFPPIAVRKLVDWLEHKEGKR